MKTIGQIIREARIAKRYSLAHVEGMTKIKSSFIDDIERVKWNSLPAFTKVLGFVKSISSVLDIDSKMIVAVLKRDYPPKKLRISPKPDVTKKISWSPRLTFIIGIAAVVLVFFGYLFIQYLHFISPPRLSVDSPTENQIIVGGNVTVFGSTETDAKVLINNQPVVVSDDGNFSVNLNVSPETKSIIIESMSRSGKKSVLSRKIEVK